MIAPGLCSVTFRSLTADDVIRVACRTPASTASNGAPTSTRHPAAVRRSRPSRRAAVDAGLEIVSYGSYLGIAPPDGTDDAAVDAVLETASALGSPMVRVWTEFGVTPSSSPAERRRVTERTAALVDRIAEHGLLTALEFHPDDAHRDRGVGHASSSARSIDRGSARTGNPIRRSRLLPHSTSSPR